MSNFDQIKKLISDCHIAYDSYDYENPPKGYNESHVYHIYNDGEITMQKAGNLYLLRKEHMMHPSILSDRKSMKYRNLFPNDAGLFNYAVTSVYEDALKIRSAIYEDARNN